MVGGVTFTNGEVVQAFSFDGGDDSVDLGSWFNLQTFSIGLWVKPNASQSTYADIIDNNHTGSRSLVVQYQNTGLQFNCGNADGGSPGIYFSLLPNTWQYLVLTRDTNNVSSLYLNGALIGTSVGTGPINYDGSQFLRLGRLGGGGRNFSGQEDEIEVYNRALSANEIAAIYLAGSYGKCPIETVPHSFDTSTTGLQWTSNGLRLRLGGLTGHGPVVIYASTNLVSWTPIYTNPPITGSIKFLDSRATNFSFRFYRAAEQ